MKLYKKIYPNIPEGKINLVARIDKDICGRFYFETSLGGKRFERNVNMPMFATEKEACEWIAQREDWKPL